MTPRSAMLTPRRLSISGVAQVSILFAVANLALRAATATIMQWHVAHVSASMMTTRGPSNCDAVSLAVWLADPSPPKESAVLTSPHPQTLRCAQRVAAPVLAEAANDKRRADSDAQGPKLRLSRQVTRTCAPIPFVSALKNPLVRRRDLLNHLTS